MEEARFRQWGAFWLPSWIDFPRLAHGHSMPGSGTRQRAERLLISFVPDLIGRRTTPHCGTGPAQQGPRAGAQVRRQLVQSCAVEVAPPLGARPVLLPSAVSNFADHATSCAHSQIKALEVELDHITGSSMGYGSAASRNTVGRR